MDIEQLNTDFAIDGQLEFIQGESGLVQANISNASAQALISTYAGQVLNYRRTDDKHDLLFVSDAAYFEQGRAIKGGIPVCWPWFGADPQGKGRGAHGFVRNRQWQVVSSRLMDDGAIQLVLGINSNAATLAIWPHAFELRIEITVGSCLEVKLVTVNKDTQPIDITQALHSYFQVGDITTSQVEGLQDEIYIDTLDHNAEKKQLGFITFDQEVDRVYQTAGQAIVITDESLKRHIRITSSGSHSAVVWNPWSDKAAAMGDFKDDEYRRMLCVETSNAGSDVITVAAGQSCSISAKYCYE